MLVRVTVTNTPLSRRTVRLMVKMTVVLALVQLFGLNSLFAVGAFYLISKYNSRRHVPSLPFKKSRSSKQKTTGI